MRSLLAICLAVLCLVLVLGMPVEAEDRARRPDTPFLGLNPLDPFAPADRDPVRLERFADLGATFVRTTPIAWGALEPAPPRSGPPRYVWKALDEAVLVWQLTGFRPVLVLTPSSSWAAAPKEGSAWVQELKAKLPAVEVAGALRSATGCTPPKAGLWTAWERFVRDVVERYDGDGTSDMPGLRAPVRHIQLLDRLTSSGWLGSETEYMRLLNATGQAAKYAAKTTRILTAGLDLMATGHAPHPDTREWDYRIGQLVPKDAVLSRMEMQRAFAHIRRVLAMPRLYDALVQVGSAHHADDVANLRFLRRHLDENEGADTELWLVDNPTRKLGAARATGVVPPKGPEQRLRRRWLPVARNPLHSKHADAAAWMRRGQAFDLVRGFSRSRAAGADVVLFLAPWDEMPKGHPSGAKGPGQGFLVARRKDAPAAGTTRTPSYWAMKQALRLLGTHRSAGETPIGAPGRSVVFRLASKKPRPWIAVLSLDSRLSWAGAPGADLPIRDVLVGLPSGRYILESCRLGPEAPTRRTIDVKESMVSLQLTPAPLYVIPTGD